MEMAMKLYSAVSNPISLEGRIRICRGALRDTDYRAALKTLAIPMVVVHGTDNMLVSAANADTLLDGRPSRHVWSHEHEKAGPSSAPDTSSADGAVEGSSEGIVDSAGSSLGDDSLKNVLLEPRAIAHLVVRCVGQWSQCKCGRD